MAEMETKNRDKVTIGLFGTCGGSKWRIPFKEAYSSQEISFFDPQVENWDPYMATIEAEHLAEDEIILFPITDETYGIGSLCETGYSILQAIRLDDRRDFVILIDPRLQEKLNENQVAAKESLRARALVKKHLEILELSNLFLVDNLPHMLEVSLKLYKAAVIKKQLLSLNPHRLTRR
jgi:hypothetical protein